VGILGRFAPGALVVGPDAGENEAGVAGVTGTPCKLKIMGNV